MVQSDAELIAKCTKPLDVIEENINGWSADESIEALKEFREEIGGALKPKMTQQQLKKELMTTVVDKSKPMTACERQRNNLIDRLSVYRTWHLHEPLSTRYSSPPVRISATIIASLRIVWLVRNVQPFTPHSTIPVSI